MEDFINHINGLGRTTLFAMTLLVFAGTYLVHVFLDARGLTMVFGTAFMLGALLAEYVFTAQGVILLDNPDANLLMMSIIGMTGSLATLVLVVKLYVLATRAPKVDERKRVW